MRLSIIVPICNNEKTLRACLDSIYSASPRGFEVIAVDDASTDSSVSVIHGYPCRLLRLKKRSGPSKVRNTGALAAKGKILFFVDADVCVRKDTFKRALERFKTEPEASAVQAVYSDKPPKAAGSRFKHAIQLFNIGCMPSGCIRDIGSFAVAIKRDAFEEVGGFDERFTFPSCEDRDLGRRLAKAGYTIVIDKELAVDHNSNSGFAEVLKKDFKRAYLEGSLIRLNWNQGLFSGKTSYPPKRFFAGILIAPILLLSAIFADTWHIGAASALLAILFLLLNFGILKYLTRFDGILALPINTSFLLFDYLAIFLGGLLGIVFRRPDAGS